MATWHSVCLFISHQTSISQAGPSPGGPIFHHATASWPVSPSPVQCPRPLLTQGVHATSQTAQGRNIGTIFLNQGFEHVTPSPPLCWNHPPLLASEWSSSPLVQHKNFCKSWPYHPPHPSLITNPVLQHTMSPSPLEAWACPVLCPLAHAVPLVCNSPIVGHSPPLTGELFWKEKGYSLSSGLGTKQVHHECLMVE